MRFGSGRGAVVAPGCKNDRMAFLTNITVRDCTFTRSSRGVRIKTSANSTTGPGCHGRMSNIVYRDLTMVDVNTTISMIMHYPCSDVTAPPECWAKFNSTSMQIDVAIENLTAVRSGWAAVIDGPSGAVGDRDAALQLHVKDVRIDSTKGGWACWGNISITGTAHNVTPAPGAQCRYT